MSPVLGLAACRIASFRHRSGRAAKRLGWDRRRYDRTNKKVDFRGRPADHRAMKITYLAHSCFLVETSQGRLIIEVTVRPEDIERWRAEDLEE